MHFYSGQADRKRPGRWQYHRRTNSHSGGSSPCSCDLIVSAIELYTLYHIARANCDKHSEKSDKKIYYNICKEMSPGKDCNQMMLQLLKLNAYHFDFQIYKNIIS